MASVMVWFLGGFASATVPALLWLCRRWMARAANHIDEMLGRRISRFPGRYRHHMLRELRFIDLKGLSTLGSSHPELDDVFVDVSLEHRAPHEVAAGVLPEARGDAMTRHRLGEFLDHAQPGVLAVLGAPGSGKTTLVRHTARQVCLSRRGRRRTVPILIYLRDHVSDIVADPCVPLSTLVRDQLGSLGHAEPAGWFTQRLDGGDCVVLLDGLDEVAKQEERGQVARWVERMTRLYPKNDFVITSRPQGYRSAPIDGATVLQVRGFSSEQVTQFVHGWYRVVERDAAEEAPGDLDRRVRHVAGDLLTRLENAPELGDLTVNPLLLTMIANVHRFRGALPGSRVELYREICQVMLWSRQEAKRLPIEPNGERKEGLLRGLAFTMMRQQVRDVPRHVVLEQLRTSLRRISTTRTEEDLLTDLSSSGLLIEREADLYSFAHLTFQEYLAAMHVRDTGDVDVLAASVDDIWWRETTLLYTARSSADAVVAACMESGSINALALAFDVEDTGDLAPELRHRLRELLTESEDDPARRRLRDGVQVTRALRRTPVRTRTGGRVCGVPVGPDIYRLFMAERQVPTPDGFDGTPVTGMWASDAIEFVTWANEVTDGVPGYRLATAAELDELHHRRPVAGTAGLSAWTHSETGEPQLWIARDGNQPTGVDGNTIRSHIHDDIRRAIPVLVHLALIDAARLEPRFWRDSNAAKFAMALVRELGVNETIFQMTVGRYTQSDNGQDRRVLHASNMLHAVELVTELDTVLTRAGNRKQFVELTRKLVELAGLDLDMVEYALQPFLPALTGAELLAWTGSRPFADKFIDDTMADKAARVVALDTLEGTIRQATAEMKASARARLAQKFATIALPVVTRTMPVTTNLATAIRITALSLATVATNDEADDLGDKYREIAAGITVIERRSDGRDRPSETLVLAVS